MYLSSFRTAATDLVESAYASPMATGKMLPQPDGAEDEPFMIGSRRPPGELRPQDSRRRVIGLVSSVSFREVRRLAVDGLIGWRRVWALTLSLGGLIGTGAVYAAGNVAGAFIAAGGSGFDIAAGAFVGLLTQPAGLYMWRRRWWVLPIARALMIDRVLFPFPRDWRLSLWLEENDASKVIALLEGLGFWNVQVWRFIHPHDRWTIVVQALSDAAAGDSRNGRVVEALNARQIPFAGFSSSPAAM